VDTGEIDTPDRRIHGHRSRAHAADLVMNTADAGSVAVNREHCMGGIAVARCDHEAGAADFVVRPTGLALRLDEAARHRRRRCGAGYDRHHRRAVMLRLDGESQGKTRTLTPRDPLTPRPRQ